jgi:hypothetical protein
MPQDDDFGLQRRARPEHSDRRPPDQLEKIAHRDEYQPIRPSPSAVLGLW